MSARARMAALTSLALAVAALQGSAVAREDPPPPPPPMLAAPSPLPLRVLRTLAHDPTGYDPSRRRVPSDVLLGDLLFHSPRILGVEAQRMGLACQSCHPSGATNRSLVLPGFDDRPGNVDLSTRHFRAAADDGIANGINIPSLRGVRYTGPYGHDGRTASLAEFTTSVIVEEFGGARLSPRELAALVRYQQDLDFSPDALVDSHGALSSLASAAARRGERVFLRRCASCHVPSSYFTDGRVHRIGSGQPASPSSLDDGYETPTLLGTSESAPYFHDGRFATLAEVVAWFDTSLELGLTPSQRAELVAYVEAVGAVDRVADDRPLGHRVAETAAYLGLLLEGESRDVVLLLRADIEKISNHIEVVNSSSKKLPLRRLMPLS